jgi:DNA invertase Pin-like site-specific DNA recombinase
MERKTGRKPRTTSSSEPAARLQRRLKAEQVADLAKSYRTGSTITELATRFGIHPQTVNEHLKRQGVPLRLLGLDPQHLKEAIRLYEEAGHSPGWARSSASD